MKYYTLSGTEYKLNDKNHVIRNGKESTHKFLGVSNYYVSRDNLMKNLKNQTVANFITYITPNSVYKFYKAGKIEVNTCSFEDAKNSINGNSNLIFINEDLEEIIMSTPILSFQKD